MNLLRHFKACQTSGKLFWTCWQSRALLEIIEKYFEASKTFQDLLNFRKIILNLLPIQETFKNHREIFLRFQDIPGLVKLQKSYFWTFLQSRRFLEIIAHCFEASKTFQDLSKVKKIILDLQAIQETFKNHRKIF